MKYTGIINRDISAMVARTGHFDRIIVSDAGFPIPAGVPCIDLSMGPNLPKVTDVLKMLTLELPIEQFWFASEIQPSADPTNAHRTKEMPLRRLFPVLLTTLALSRCAVCKNHAFSVTWSSENRMMFPYPAT